MDSSVNNSILAVSTHKDINNPMGTFNIVLGPRIAKQLMVEKGTLLVSDVIEPFDLVQIEFKTDATDYKTEMIGLVSRPAVDLSIDAKGRPIRVIKISGFDFGKALQSFKIFFNPFVDSKSLQQYGGVGAFGRNKTIFSNKSAAGFIAKFIQYCFTNPLAQDFVYPLTFGSGYSLTDYVDFVSGISTVFKTNHFTDPFVLLGIGAGNDVSVYDIIKSYSEPPLHEAFIDLRRTPGAETTHRVLHLLPSTDLGKINVDTIDTGLSSAYQFQQPYVFYMRTTPFSQANWSQLTRHTFLQTDVRQQDVATSEDNIYNYYEVHCERENFVLGMIQVSNLVADTFSRVPIFDQQSIKNYGFRKFPFNQTKYVEFVYKQDKANLDLLKKQASLIREIFRWFSYGELFESGTISLKGRVGIDENGITMGNRLVEIEPGGTPTGKEFYIEGVMQEWVFGQAFKTSCAVTRGHVPINTTEKNGVQVPGRFAQVAALERSLLLDQETNGTFFEPIPS